MASGRPQILTPSSSWLGSRNLLCMQFSQEILALFNCLFLMFLAAFQLAHIGISLICLVSVTLSK